MLRKLSTGPLRWVLRFMLGALLTLWLVDKLVFFASETIWFGATGFGELWRAQLFTRLAIMLLFVVPAWVLAVPCLKVAAHPAGAQVSLSGGPLPGVAARLEPLRRLAPRLALWSALLVPVVLGLGLANHWQQWLQLRFGAPWGYQEPRTGLDASLWVFTLPFLQVWIQAASTFVTLLFLVVAVGGGLRALPQLLVRRPLVPQPLLRALWFLGAGLLLLRSVEYLIGALGTFVATPVDASGWWVPVPPALLGALGCWALAGWLVRNALRGSAQVSRVLVVCLLLVLLAPSLMARLLTPFASLGGGNDQEARVAAAHAAWGPVTAIAPNLGAEPWPVWSLEALLQANPGGGFTGPRTVTWNAAHITWDQGWKGVLAGVPSAASVWTDPREVGATNALVLSKQDLGQMRAGRPEAKELSSALPLPVFGLEGRHLLAGTGGEEQPGNSTGVPLASWGSRLLWSWRLREPLLLFEARDATHLLVYRGAVERAEKLFPFLTVAGAPQPVARQGRVYWTLDLVTRTANFPGVPAMPRGLLTGVNAARHSFKMLMDARTGAITLVPWPPMQTSTSSPSIDPMAGVWSRAFPSLVTTADENSLTRVAAGFPATLVEALAWEESRFLGSVAAPREPYLLGGPGQQWTATWVKGSADQFFWLGASATGQVVLLKGQGPIDVAQSRMDGAFPGLEKSGEFAELVLEAPQQPVIWPDKAALGGWMVARAVYAVPEGAMPIMLTTGRGRRLWRVAVTDLGGTAVGVGPTLAAALLDRDQQMGVSTRPVVLTPGLGRGALLQRAAAANDAAQRYFKSGQFGAMGRELAAQRRWLQELSQLENRSGPAPER